MKPEITPPFEEVGFSGPLSQLPGNNPITMASISMRSRVARNIQL